MKQAMIIAIMLLDKFTSAQTGKTFYKYMFGLLSKLLHACYPLVSLAEVF